MRWLLIPVLMALIARPAPAHAAERRARWERIEVGVGETAFVAVAVAPSAADQLFAATPRHLYRSSDGGQHWQRLFRVPGSAIVSGLAVEEPPALRAVGPEEAASLAIVVATDHGLYGSFDRGARWSQVFRGADNAQAQCTVVAFHPATRGTALLGTRSGLFRSVDRGRHWSAIEIPRSAREIAHVACHPQEPDRLYLLGPDGLYAGDLAGGQWRQRFPVIRSDTSEADTPPADDTDEAAEPHDPAGPDAFSVGAVVLDPQEPSTIYLAGLRGVDVSRDGGMSWRSVSRSGLESTAMSHLVVSHDSPRILYAATARGVARYEPGPERWQMISEGLATTPIRDLAAATDALWAATDQGLYRYDVVPEAFGEGDPPSAQELLAHFTHEPTIGQVRDVAIRYAEVHPDKIAQWRRQAALKALFPKVAVGIDRSRSHDAHFDEGTFPKFQIVETQDQNTGLDFSVTWDLGDLIWNDDQTSIDVRSKLMVQLRDDIVDEVTRTYFERRRLQVALLSQPPSEQQDRLDKALRLQELTALIDGLTGGYFSKQTPADAHDRRQ